MTKTIDTNILIFAIISDVCNNEVKEIDRMGIILYSVNKETDPKLLELYRIFSTLKDESLKCKDLEKLLLSERYSYFQNKYKQIFNSFLGSIKKNKFSNEEFIDKINILLNDITKIKKLINSKRLYPEKEDYENIKQTKIYKETDNKISKIIKNRGDIEHLALCQCYIKNKLNENGELHFLTLDLRDFYKKDRKEKIEKIIKNLKIKTIENFNFEEFNIF